MARMLELVQPRDWTNKSGATGTTWTRLGKAWMNDDGTGSLEFDALPIPTLKDGKLETRVLLREPMKRDADAPRPAANRPATSGGNDLNDDVPF